MVLLAVLPYLCNAFTSYVLDKKNQQTPQYRRAGPVHLEKRDLSPSAIRFGTDWFKFVLTCDAPFGDASNVTCLDFRDALQRAARRIEHSVLLRRPVTVVASYTSLCDGVGQMGKACTADDSTLGFAYPLSWHKFSQSEARQYGLDSDYLYPISLARQYVSNLTQLNSYPDDLSITINSDFNWMFSNGSGKLWGNAEKIKGGAFNRQAGSYDIEQVIVHEILHGLGFISSWGPWIAGLKDSFVPSFLDYDDSGAVVGLAPEYIFSRWMSDAVHNVWMNVYSSLIRESIDSSISGGFLDEADFDKSLGGNIARALKAGPLITPNGMRIWYPSTGKNKNVLKSAVIYTPKSYRRGSSLSHFDSGVYRDTRDYLMRPGAIPRVFIDQMIPYAEPLGPATLGILRGMGYVTFGFQ
jgi:hypothetical protein